MESAEFSGQDQVVAEPAAGSMQWGLDGNGRSTNIFVSFEGTLVAGEDNYLALFAELAENFYDAFVAFIVKNSRIYRPSRQGEVRRGFSYSLIRPNRMAR